MPNALVVIVSIFSHDLSVHGNNKHKWGHWIRSSFFCNPQASPDWNEETRNFKPVFFFNYYAPPPALLKSPRRETVIAATMNHGGNPPHPSSLPFRSSLLETCVSVRTASTHISVPMAKFWFIWNSNKARFPEVIRTRRKPLKRGVMECVKERVLWKEIERRRKETCLFKLKYDNSLRLPLTHLTRYPMHFGALHVHTEQVIPHTFNQ